MLEPSITLAMDYQLADFEAFCTNSDHCSVLSVDPTFDLGSLSETVTSCKNFQLVKRTGDAPTFVGPLLIHYQKTFSCYNAFASSLVDLNRKLANILVFRTDGECALIDAFHQQCPDAIHPTCFTHCRGNIKHKLHELGIPADVISNYLHDIFGIYQGDTFLEGLVDSPSAVEFEKNLDALHDVWNSREEQFHSPPQFFLLF